MSKYITLTDSEFEIMNIEARVNIEDLCGSIDLHKMLEHYDKEEVVEWVVNECEGIDTIEKIRDEELDLSELQDLLVGTLNATATRSSSGSGDSMDTIVEWAKGNDELDYDKSLLVRLLDEMTPERVREVLEAHEHTKAMLNAPTRKSLIERANREGLDVEAMLKSATEVLDDATALAEANRIINGLVSHTPRVAFGPSPMELELVRVRMMLSLFWGLVQSEQQGTEDATPTSAVNITEPVPGVYNGLDDTLLDAHLDAKSTHGT